MGGNLQFEQNHILNYELEKQAHTMVQACQEQHVKEIRSRFA